MKTEIQAKEIIIKGLKVYYSTAGNPQNQVIVFLNGWGARFSGIFGSRKIIKQLAGRGFFVYSPEHPGLMRSETPKYVWGVEEYVADLNDFITKLNIQNLILIGQSFGGSIATAYAYRHSANLKTLILVSSGVSSDKPNGRFFWAWFYGKLFKKLLLAPLAPRILKKILVSWFLGVPWNFTQKNTFEEHSIMGEIFKNWLLENRYAQIKIKTILVWGKRDTLIPISSAEKVVQELSHGILFKLNGGHSILYTRTKMVVNFIAGKI